MRGTKAITEWIPFSVRIFYNNGESKYCRMTIARLEGMTDEELTAYLVKDYTELLQYAEDVEKVKLISVNRNKVNQMLTRQ